MQLLPITQGGYSRLGVSTDEVRFMGPLSGAPLLR